MYTVAGTVFWRLQALLVGYASILHSYCFFMVVSFQTRGSNIGACDTFSSKPGTNAGGQVSAFDYAVIVLTQTRYTGVRITFALSLAQMILTQGSNFEGKVVNHQAFGEAT